MPRTAALRAPALLLVLLLAAGCDTKPPARARPSGDAFNESPAVTEEAAGGVLQAPVRLERPFATAGSSGNLATVPLDPSWRYQWTAEGGTITEGVESNEARYDAGLSGEVILRCRILGPGGVSLLTSAQQTIVPAPEIFTFEAVPPALTPGATGKLTWTVRQSARLTLDPGGQDVLRRGSMEITPTAATTYRLTATNLAETRVFKEVTVNLVPLPRIRSFGWTGSRKLGEPLDLKAEFEGGRAEIRDGDNLLGSSTESPLVVSVTPTPGKVYTLRVANDSGAATTQSLLAVAKPPAPPGP